MKRFLFVPFMFYFLLLCHLSVAQGVIIQMGADEIGVNQAFTITVTVKNESLKRISDFPNLQGFSKKNISSSSSTNYVNGRMSSSQSRTMNYIPRKEGTFTIPPFTITVNGNEIRSPGKKVKVGPPVQRNRRGFFDQDPFDDFFGRPQRQAQEFVDVEADAFLAITSDKSEVYQGEGFTATLAFYVSAKNKADMRFHELGKQITKITSKIKPSNCWEESFNIDNITGETVTINNQRFTQYKVYQATFYPWNTETITFPSVNLELIKYKVAKNPSFFGRRKQENFQKFSSKPKSIKVKDLPPHPMKETVAVGNYRLSEEIDKKTVETGESFDYTFKVSGIGNINAIQDPIIPSDQEDINIYDPNKQMNINRSRNRVSGTKSFNYYGIPNEPGKYNLSEFFNWVYFDPIKEIYDTLSSKVEIVVTGESKKNESISATDLGSFYDRIEFENNILSSNSSPVNSKLLMNILLFIVLAVAGIILGKKTTRLGREWFRSKKEPSEVSLIKHHNVEHAITIPETEPNSIFERLGENPIINALGWGIIVILVTMIVEFIAVQLETELIANIYSIFYIVAIPSLFYLFSRRQHKKKQKVKFGETAASFINITVPFFVYLFVFEGIAIGSQVFSMDDLYFGLVTYEFIELVAFVTIIPGALVAAYFSTHWWNKKLDTAT